MRDGPLPVRTNARKLLARFRWSLPEYRQVAVKMTSQQCSALSKDELTFGTNEPLLACIVALST